MSWQIPVYKQEKLDKIDHLVKSQSSIAFACQVKASDEQVKSYLQETFLKTSAAVDRNQPDLFYLDSILSTIGRNKNDDIFISEEMYPARHSICEKPLNIGHKQVDVIGHVTSSISINDDFDIIEDACAMEDLPDKWHILVGMVLYKVWEDKTQAEKVEKVIAKINDGTMHTSMECLFRGFDYGLTSTTGEYKIIQRNQDTAFLTKKLRAYGGDGKYEDYSIGRVLKSITFSANGLVENPANPDSKIFTLEKFSKEVATFKTNFANVGYKYLSNNHSQDDLNLQGEIIMANENTDSVTLLKSELESYKAKAEQAVATQVANLEKNVSTLTIAVEDEKKKTKKAEDETKAAEAKAEKAEKDKEDEKKEKDKAVAAKEKAEKELDAEKETIKEYKRASAYVVKTGKTEEDAKAFLKTFAGVSDEVFDAALALVVAGLGALDENGKKVTKKGKTEEETKDGKESELKTVKANADPETVLATAEADKTATLGGVADNKIESARAELSSFLGTALANNRGTDRSKVSKKDKK